ncbi:hypothetical protein NKJ40_29185 [Mesorhizobium sp. M0119]
MVKGTKVHAEEIREECRAFLEDRLKLTLNMEKTHITHVDDGFVFLGHRSFASEGRTGACPSPRRYPTKRPRRLFAN